MNFEELVQPESVLCNARARSKKHCLEILSELLVRTVTDVTSDDMFEGLIERERLGCTGLFGGVAFPHCRVDGLDTSIGALIKLSDAIEFDAADDEPVDLVFGLAVPANLDSRHHAEVRDVANYLRETELRTRLREANTSNELYEALCA